MEVSATQSAAQALQSQTTVQPAGTDEINAFTRALFGQNAQTPEQQVVDRFQQVSQQVDRALAPARDTGAMLASPLEMLATQSTMLRSIIEVDLMAKTAGAVSQGVNKLVNMQ
ncbi:MULTISPECIES: type III secretion system inner rod subunit SctI [unclassified Burkholderia]|uniref:type III secretion system inner rod subunit SctI n=1 Tax=unclassified Burkholderia TaxID=2613784 RepID=UPI0007529AD2|nr:MULTISPECIES: type III secretion system inner rod subunit SctI [unclassified Burkholderia]KVN03472.1 type III secretion system protein [Burkholderia sp. MSMB1552]KWZ55904.1 type III secretion system protein [Burkholderia sp. MSMB1588]